MNTKKSVALIECSDGAKQYILDMTSQENGYQVTKILAKSSTGENIIRGDYPQSEFVQDTRSIFDDKNIELVIVNAPGDNDLHVVAQALEAGKQVRIV